MKKMCLFGVLLLSTSFLFAQLGESESGSSKVKEYVFKGKKVTLGMTDKKVRELWGKPEGIDDRTDNNDVDETWDYFDGGTWGKAVESDVIDGVSGSLFGKLPFSSSATQIKTEQQVRSYKNQIFLTFRSGTLTKMVISKKK